MHLEQYDRIRARLAETGLTPQDETRIAIFLCATKTVNLPFLALASAAPPVASAWFGQAAAPAEPGPGGVIWQYVNTQLFRESEALALVCRVTRWAPDPLLYATSVPLVAPLYAEGARVGFTGWSSAGGAPGIEALAFGYALLGTVRLLPIIPAAEAESAFAVALARIEQENGRLLQTQIRLLKDGFPGTPLAEREAAVAAKLAVVDGAFDHLLDALAR